MAILPRQDRAWCAELLELAVDHGIDPAVKKDATEATLAVGATLQAFDVGVRHRLVMRQRKHQCDIYVDPAGNELLDSRNSLARRRNFNHHVGPTDRTVEPLGLGNRRLRVAR